MKYIHIPKLQSQFIIEIGIISHTWYTKITVSLTYMYVCSQSRLGAGGVQSFTLIVKPNASEGTVVRSSKEPIYFANNREVSIR